MQEIRLPFHMKLPVELLTLANHFTNVGKQLYVVGGAVRDAVMGIPPKDFDVATDAAPEEVKSLLEPHGYSLLLVGESFGVVAVVFPHPLEKIEIATFREDLSSGRHPEVRFATIKEDVMRRDLTINALFYDISNNEIVDLVGGLEDIKNNIVRAVGNPLERFNEDNLRILRAIRFACRFDATIDRDTALAIDYISDVDGLPGVSHERIRDEFIKGLSSSRKPSTFIGLLGAFDLLKCIFPDLSVTRKSVVRYNEVVSAIALLLECNDVSKLSSCLHSSCYSSHEISQVCFLLRFKDLSVENAYKLRKAATSCCIADEQMQFYFMQRGLPDAKLYKAFLKYSLSVSGDDVMAAGFSGPAIGKEIERRETELFRGFCETR